MVPLLHSVAPIGARQARNVPPSVSMTPPGAEWNWKVALPLPLINDGTAPSQASAGGVVSMTAAGPLGGVAMEFRYTSAPDSNRLQAPLAGNGVTPPNW